MAEHSASAATGFPDVGRNRTRKQASQELADYVGGRERAVVLNIAGRAWDAAVREYNSVIWKFTATEDTLDLTAVSAGTKTMALQTGFRAPRRAKLLDLDGKVDDILHWVDYDQWTFYCPEESTNQSQPSIYTAFNSHEDGTIIFDPPTVAGASMQHATLRFEYFDYIQLAAGDTDRLAVPMEVDEGIFQLALGKFIAMQRSFRDARDVLLIAGGLRVQLEQEHRGFPDIKAW